MIEVRSIRFYDLKYVFARMIYTIIDICFYLSSTKRSDRVGSECDGNGLLLITWPGVSRVFVSTKLTFRREFRQTRLVFYRIKPGKEI